MLRTPGSDPQKYMPACPESLPWCKKTFNRTSFPVSLRVFLAYFQNEYACTHRIHSCDRIACVKTHNRTHTLRHMHSISCAMSFSDTQSLSKWTYMGKPGESCDEVCWVWVYLCTIVVLVQCSKKKVFVCACICWYNICMHSRTGWTHLTILVLGGPIWQNQMCALIKLNFFLSKIELYTLSHTHTRHA